MKEEDVKKVVRKGYAEIARKGDSSCCSNSCCGSSGPETISKQIGYTDEDLKGAPEGANLGLGCGNPVALASLKDGDVVLDLGSGAGFDCFLAAKKVGLKGRVIGVDMTPEMIERARGNARKDNYENVEFRLGEIENLPAANDSVNVVISNCVINLSPDKERVFREAFRVLRPGGRLMVSDIVLLKELPASIRDSVEAYVGCLSGAISKEKYVDALKRAGFEKVEIVDETGFPIELMANDPTAQKIMESIEISSEELASLAHAAVSVKVSATKPG